MNIMIFWCVTLKIFSFSFVPLLERNPGDANGVADIKHRDQIL